MSPSTNKKSTTSKKKTVSNNTLKDDKKKIDKSNIALLCVLIALIITVCVLFGMVLKKKKEVSSKPVANIVIPVIKKDNKMTFSLDLYSMKENEEYIFKITNYRGNKVIDSDIDYIIHLKNDTDAKIEVYRIGNDKVDLMKDNPDKEIKDLKVYKDEKEEIYFKVVVSNLKNVKEKELASFMILS